MKRWTGTLEERFLRHVGPRPSEGCWLWQGAIISTGYGKMTWQYQQMLAHRVSYELHVGPIPEGKQIDHLCRVRACINPEHLDVVDQHENLRRGRAARLVCRHGHAMPSTGRCRLCARITDRRRRARQRAAR